MYMIFKSKKSRKQW